jgi:CubicO group peptidase (beta-lactamase class C family)
LGEQGGTPGIEQILGALPEEDILTCGRLDLPECSRNGNRLPTTHYPNRNTTTHKNLESLAKIFKERPMSGPYERAIYSNEAFSVLAYAYEGITGQPFDEGLKGNVFEPLGMDRSFLYLPSEDDGNFLRLIPPDIDDTLRDLGALAP